MCSMNGFLGKQKDMQHVNDILNENGDFLSHTEISE